ncbi:MAG: hypothetical protein NT062_38190, partial [Proteobacteria bacterium]|nr:hypothetical protein [Pseudomonadota bacterium]
IDDGSRLYWASVQHENFSAFSGPVVAMGYDGSAITPRTTEYGAPVAVQAGQLYYRHDEGLARVPVAGGAAQVIATGLADTTYTDRAIDDAYAYAATAAAPYAIRRFPVAGGPSELVLEANRGDVEVSLDPPHDLRRDGDSLYFLQRMAGEVDVLYRVRLEGPPVAEPIAQAAELGAPVFDATAIYVAYQRGGGDAPIEGVIARIAK